MAVLDNNQIMRARQILPLGVVEKVEVSDDGKVIATSDERVVTFEGLEPHWLDFILNGIKLERVGR